MRILLESFANSLWQGLLIAAVCWIGLIVARRTSAATRYAVWWLALAAVAALPLLTTLWHVDAAPAITAVERSEPSPDPIAAPPGVATAPESPGAFPVALEPVAHVGPSTDPPAATLRLPDGGGGVAVILCVTLAAIARLTRVLFQFLRLRRIKQRAAPVSVLGAPERLLTRSARLAVSDEARAPLLAGFMDPVILIPGAHLEELTTDELRQVVAHEQAHARRWDDWTNLAQKLIEAVLFFNPAVHWIGRRLQIEREIACDDLVVDGLDSTRPYAACLTRVAELAVPLRAHAAAPGVAMNKKQISRRVEMLLNRKRNRATRCSLKVLMCAAAVVAFMLVAFLFAPPLVAVEVDSPEEPAAEGAEPAAAAQGGDQRDQEVQERKDREAQRRREAAEQRRVRAEEVRQQEQERRQRAEQRRHEAEERRREEDDNRSRSHYRYKNSSLWASLQVELRGQVDFTDDDRDVRQLSPDGRVEIEERQGLTFRRVELSADSAGGVKRLYYVNGLRRPDEEARTWLAAVLPGVIRETAIGAPERVRRIVKQGGVAGVLAEIGRISSDRSKRIYFEELLATGAVSRDQTREILRRVARDIHSDSEKARFMIRLLDAPRTEHDSYASVISAAASISSDGERRRVLSALLAKQLDATTLSELCRVAAGINSDGEKARLLIEVAETYDVEPVRTAFFRGVDSVSSSGEQARILGAVLARPKLSRDVVIQSIRSASEIHSDGEKSRALSQAAQAAPADDAVHSALVRAIETISSDGEKARALIALVDRALSPVVASQVARAASGISSDGEKSRVLRELAAGHKLQDPAGAAFFEAADTISSDGERRRALASALQNTDGQTPANLVRLLKSARGINSDGEKAKLLEDLAETCPPDETVINAYVQTAETISSNGEYRRVYAALARKHPTKLPRKV